MLLQGKAALVTGAGQGVGQGIALALAAEGARVAVTGRTLAKLESTCELISERGGEAMPVECQRAECSAGETTVLGRSSLVGTVTTTRFAPADR